MNFTFHALLFATLFSCKAQNQKPVESIDNIVTGDTNRAPSFAAAVCCITSPPKSNYYRLPLSFIFE